MWAWVQSPALPPPTCMSWPPGSLPALFSHCHILAGPASLTPARALQNSPHPSPLTPASFPTCLRPTLALQPPPSLPAVITAPPFWGWFPAPGLCHLHPPGFCFPRNQGVHGVTLTLGWQASGAHRLSAGLVLSSARFGDRENGQKWAWDSALEPHPPCPSVTRQRGGAQTPVGTSTRKKPQTERPAMATLRPPPGPPAQQDSVAPLSSEEQRPHRLHLVVERPSAPEGSTRLLWMSRVPPHWPLGCCSS